MRKILLVVGILLLVDAPVAHADLFGGDVAVLAQILQETIQELMQLKEILSTGEDTLNLMRDINRGVNDSLKLIKTAYPDIDPGIFGEWDKVQMAMQGIEGVYGSVPVSPDSIVQTDTDQSVAEAITLNNSIYKYTKDIDDIGETIKQYSHDVSPGGAQKLTAQSLGIMIHVMNENLRVQATGLKIQAQALALQNHKEKESTRYFIDTADTLGQALSSQDVSYQLPRF